MPNGLSKTLRLDTIPSTIYNMEVIKRGSKMEEDVLRDADFLNHTVEVLIDQLHEAVSHGDYAEANLYAKKIRELEHDCN
jgi:hypothetical protein